jgi:hypothetical protein
MHGVMHQWPNGKIDSSVGPGRFDDRQRKATPDKIWIKSGVQRDKDHLRERKRNQPWLVMGGLIAVGILPDFSTLDYQVRKNE